MDEASWLTVLISAAGSGVTTYGVIKGAKRGDRELVLKEKEAVKREMTELVEALVDKHEIRCPLAKELIDTEEKLRREASEQISRESRERNIGREDNRNRIEDMHTDLATGQESMRREIMAGQNAILESVGKVREVQAAQSQRLDTHEKEIDRLREKVNNGRLSRSVGEE